MSKPVYQKLGFKDQSKYALINAPNAYITQVQIPNNLKLKECSKDCDLIHIFSNELEDLVHQLNSAYSRIAQNGMIWVSWYKKSSGKQSELTEDLIREMALEKGLVDIKVCAIDHEWSALKLVIPLKNRK